MYHDGIFVGVDDHDREESPAAIRTNDEHAVFGQERAELGSDVPSAMPCFRAFEATFAPTSALSWYRSLSVGAGCVQSSARPINRPTRIGQVTIAPGRARRGWDR